MSWAHLNIHAFWFCFKITCKSKENRFSLNARPLELHPQPWRQLHIPTSDSDWEVYTKQKSNSIKFCFVFVFLNKTDLSENHARLWHQRVYTLGCVHKGPGCVLWKGNISSPQRVLAEFIFFSETAMAFRLSYHSKQK